jgi:GLPGLI family protein
MKRLFIPAIALLAATTLHAQQKEGRIIYERTMATQISIAGNPELERQLSKPRINRFEVNFKNDQMTSLQLPDDTQDADAGSGGGLTIRTVGFGSNDIVFCDFKRGLRIEQKEMFEKIYLVTDSIKMANWKLSDETMDVLGHPCRKATTERIIKRTSMRMENGKMENKEVIDTSLAIAWYATDIPVPGGPEMQGQLPGMILQLEMNNGKLIYRAVEINAKATASALKEPTKGKKMTATAFAEERKKMTDEMRKNSGGVIRIGG